MKEFLQVSSFRSSRRARPARRPRTTLARHVRDALAHLHDFAYLQTHPLAATLAGNRSAATTNAGRLLHDRLVQAIEAFRPPQGASPHVIVRSYQLLRLRYVEGKAIQEVCAELSISESAYLRTHSQCLEALVALLEEQILSHRHAGPESLPGDDHEASALDRPTNLPRPLTSFVGRKRALAEVERLLSRARLLTLTGRRWLWENATGN